MFPGATTSREEAAYVVAGAPLDVSTSFRPGTRFGPERIRRLRERHGEGDAVVTDDAGDGGPDVPPAT